MQSPNQKGNNGIWKIQFKTFMFRDPILDERLKMVDILNRGWRGKKSHSVLSNPFFSGNSAEEGFLKGIYALEIKKSE